LGGNSRNVIGRDLGCSAKRVKLDTNHRAEIWKSPQQNGKPGKARIVVVPMLEAARKQEARPLGTTGNASKPHPAAKLLMRLHKNDCIAIGDGDDRKIMRVVKFSSGVVALAGVNEGGALHGATVVHRPVASVGVAHPVYAHPVYAHPVYARPYEVPVCSYHAMGERVCP
jgi:hypothetical protein